METKVITEKDLVKNPDTGFYEYNANFQFEGNVEIAENLDCVKFGYGLVVTGYIYAKAGTGIKAGEGIKAGMGIKAGLGIKAGWGIEAGTGIKAGEGIEAGEGIVTWYYGGIVSKWVISLRIAVGFYLGPDKVQTIKAEIRKETPIILGKVEVP